MDAALSGLRGSETAVLERLMQRKGAQPPQREAAIGMTRRLAGGSAVE